ncbi:MAG TPA: NUDIX domain-containing protein [Methylomirabilota bacterium]
MSVTSAGLLVYRCREGGIEVLLVHPGGPFWARRDEGAWSIPKGEYGPGEDALTVAFRELEEETGTRMTGTPLPLTPVRQRGGKQIAAWAVEGDLDAGAIRSNAFRLEWPPRSGQTREFPEVDRAAWFTLDEAAVRINPGQRRLLDDLRRRLTP